MLRRVAYRTDLDLSGSGRNADHHLDVRCEKRSAAAVDLLDESSDHHLRSVEVSDDAVLHRADCLDAGVLSLLHQFRLLAKRDGLACIIVNSYDARLVKHDLIILKNDSIRCSEVHRKLLGQE